MHEDMPGVYSLGNKQTQTGQNGDGHTWTYPIRNVLLRCALINTRHDSCFSMESSSVKVDKISLPRENMSLPSNMQLNDLSTLHKGKTLLLRDRCLIRTEAEVSSMVQSNYSNWKQWPFWCPGHWHLSLWSSLWLCPICYSTSSSPMLSLCSTRDRQTPPWGQDERGRGGSVCCLRCQG